MKASQTSKPQQIQKKPQPLVLSKKNLLELIENKKMKTARSYIQELRNSNPKAEKVIKEVLEEVFCKRQVSSGSLYMYGLVFYKNLLISGQLDYYEDNEFFPHEIHDAVAKICEYNLKQENLKLKGVDYFNQCVKVNANEKVKQDLEGMGVAVIIYAMELLQSMAEWYKEDYFTGEQSRFLKAYNACLKKGIVFPKKSDYAYIKEQDKAEFQQNYLELFEQNQQQPTRPQDSNHKNPKVQTKKQPQLSYSSKLLQFQQLQSKITKTNTQKDTFNTHQHATNHKSTQSNNTKLNQIEPKTFPPSNLSNPKPFPNNPASSLLSKVQQNKTFTQDKKSPNIQSHHVDDLLEKVQLEQVSTGKKKGLQPQEKSQQKSQELSQNKNLQDSLNLDIPQQLNQASKVGPRTAVPSEQPSYQNNKKAQTQTTKPNKKKEELVKNLANQTENREQTRQLTESINKKPEEINKKKDQIQKKQNSRVIVVSPFKKNIKRTQEAIHKAFQLSFPPKNNQNNEFLKTKNSNHLQRTSISGKRKHKIFEKVPQRNPSALKSKIQESSCKKKQSSTIYQFSDQIKINILSSNMSFSPNYLAKKKYDNLNQSQVQTVQRKKSVPKTQKKFLQKTFGQNQDLIIKFGLTQNIFNIGQDTSKAEKFPMKSLSTWRCQKQIKRDHSPQNRLNYQSLIEVLKKLKFRELCLPFVPEYFEPVTLKMFGLRKSALQLSGFTQTSQIFFNNKIIEARLMKPARNFYILSILNVSRFSLKISPANMNKIPHSSHIKILSHGISQDSITVLNSGCYMDIHFSFQTSDLNFKFLTFNLLIDQGILPLQLPVTLLDQSQVENGIEVNNIISYSKKSFKIINSDSFSLNRSEIPNFMKKKFEISQRTKRQVGFNEEDCWSFTLKMKVKDSEIWSTLNCCVLPQNKNTDRWRVEIIFDSAHQQTEAFAKVMVEMLTFLLWQ